jgi:hypothetical protein
MTLGQRYVNMLDTLAGLQCMNGLPRSTSLLSTMASPVSFPPTIRAATAPGTPFLSRTLATILVTAIEHSGVVGDGFQTVALPAAMERATFLDDGPRSIQRRDQTGTKME